MLIQDTVTRSTCRLPTPLRCMLEDSLLLIEIIFSVSEVMILDSWSGEENNMNYHSRYEIFVDEP